MPTPEVPPSIALSLTLTPTTHSYKSPHPPTLSLTATSHAPRPLTLLTWGTVLHPHLALLQSAFRITDLTTDAIVPQGTVMLSRGPIQRRQGAPDGDCFLTVCPKTPATVSALFGRPVDPACGNGPPRPEGDPGRMRQAARGMVPRSVCGVDGLVVGREYELRVIGGLEVGWWRWGTREETLEPEGSGFADLGESEEGFVMEDGVEPVVFRVVE